MIGRGDDHRGDLARFQGLAQVGETDAVTRIARNFQYGESERIDRLEHAEVGGSFDCDGVAGFGHRAKRKIERFGAAHGDDQFVVGQ